MFKVIIAVLTFLVFSLSNEAFAHQSFRNVYSSTNVTTGAPITVIASLANPCLNIAIFDSSGQTMKLIINLDTANPILIPPGGDAFHLGISGGSLVQLQAVSGIANSGEIDINFL